MLADLMWWYGWSPQEVDDLELEALDMWLKQAQRQIKAGYRKGMF